MLNNFEKFSFPSIEKRWTKDKETDSQKEKKKRKIRKKEKRKKKKNKKEKRKKKKHNSSAAIMQQWLQKAKALDYQRHPMPLG